MGYLFDSHAITKEFSTNSSWYNFEKFEPNENITCTEVKQNPENFTFQPGIRHREAGLSVRRGLQHEAVDLYVYSFANTIS